MHNHSFSVGQALIFRNVKYSIIRIVNDDAYYLEDNSGALLVLSNSQLLNAYGTAELVFLRSMAKLPVVSESEPTRNILSFPQKQQEVAILRAQYVMRVDEHCKQSGIVAAVATAISDLAPKGKKPPSSKTIYLWHVKWVRSGRDICSLIPNSRGPRKYTSHFSQDIQQRIYSIINSRYLTEDRERASDIYYELKKSILEDIENGNHALRIPSKQTFYRFIKRFDEYDIELYRSGRSAADKKFRFIGAGPRSTRALERAEIDHTPLDVILVDEVTGETLGRAWLTLILDHYTRMPLGFYISHSTPAQVAVMRALQHAILPKTYMQERYPHISGEWTTFGIFGVLVLDNGLELHAHNIRRACASLGITMQFCPPKQPHYKGSIERFLGTLNRAVCHRLPGTTRSNIKERGDYDSQSFAAFTIAELIELLHMWVIDVYMNAVHKTTNCTPRQLWNQSTKNFPPILANSREELEILLSHQATKQLSRRGVVHKHLWYNNEELYALYRRHGDNTKITYHFNVEDLGNIWVIDEFEQSYIKVPAVWFDYADGLTAEQHRQIRKLMEIDALSDGSHEAMLEGRRRLYQRIREMSDSNKMRERRAAHNLASPNGTLTESLSAMRDEPVETYSTSGAAEDSWKRDINDLPSFSVHKEGDQHDSQ